jgi:hypothetical protein
MRPRLRYLLLTAGRTRTPLAPLAVTLLMLIGTYAYARNEPGATFGLTALACTALAAWLVGAVLAGEPGPQGDMATTALGGRRTLDLLLVALVALALTVLFIGFPLALRQLAVPNLFEPAARPGDVAGAVLAHLCCSALGGALGVLGGPAAVAQTLSDAAAGTVDGAELDAALSCLALAAASLGAAGWWTRRFG